MHVSLYHRRRHIYFPFRRDRRFIRQQHRISLHQRFDGGSDHARHRLQRYCSTKNGRGPIGRGEAKNIFTFISVVTIVFGVVTALGSLFFLDPIIYGLGSSDQLYPYCYDYLKLLILFAPACLLQVFFQSLFVTAGKPGLGLCLTITAGLANVILDYVFIVPLEMGISGAAWGTIIGYMIPSSVGILFFSCRRQGLRFAKFRFNGNALKNSCLNGSSEMVTNLSAGIVTFLFNSAMMRFLGEKGVAAMTIVLYGQFLFSALYMGFSIGVAPVISYNYGNNNVTQLKKVFKYCMLFLTCCSLVIFASSLLFAKPVTAFFAKNDIETYGLALHGFYLFAVCYLFSGINIFASAMFTALSDGRVSATISFLRTFVFIVLGILLLAWLLQVDGIWLAVPFAEFAAFGVSLWFLRRKRTKYQYW